MGDNDLIRHVIHDYGYLGLALSLVLNCIGIPIASEILLPLTGVYAASAGLDLAVVVVIAIIAQIIGLTLAYYIALKGGVELLEKYGKYVFLKHRELVKFHKIFRKHGSGLILLGSCIPGVHGYMGFTAGLAEMKLYPFLTTIFVGATVWTVVLVGLGAIFSHQVLSVIAAAGDYGAVIPIILVFIALSIWYIKLRNRKQLRKKK
jgi:membrane protein DedA with SNARE-associated domain